MLFSPESPWLSSLSKIVLELLTQRVGAIPNLCAHPRDCGIRNLALGLEQGLQHF